jgi:hypothetical protein
MIAEGLTGTEFRQGTREISLSDATREALVLWLNAANNSRMRSQDLRSLDTIPIRINNRLRFGDVFAEED